MSALPGTSDDPDKIFALPSFVLSSNIPEVLKRASPFLHLEIDALNVPRLVWKWPTPNEFKDYFRSMFYDEDTVAALVGIFSRYRIGGIHDKPTSRDKDLFAYKVELEGTYVECSRRGCVKKVQLNDYFFATVESDGPGSCHSRMRSRRILWTPPCPDCCADRECTVDLCWQPGRVAALGRHKNRFPCDIHILDDFTKRLAESFNIINKMRMLFSKRGSQHNALPLLETSSNLPLSYCLQGSLNLQAQITGTLDPIQTLCQIGINPSALPKPMCKSISVIVDKLHRLASGSSSYGCVKVPKVSDPEAPVINGVIDQMCKFNALDVFAAKNGTKYFIRSKDAKCATNIKNLMKSLGSRASFHCYCLSEVEMARAAQKVMGQDISGDVFVPYDAEERIGKLGFVTVNMHTNMWKFSRVVMNSQVKNFYVLFSECLSGHTVQELLSLAHRAKKNVHFVGSFRTCQPIDSSDSLSPFAFLVGHLRVPVQWCPDDFIIGKTDDQRVMPTGLVHINGFETPRELGSHLYDSGRGPIRLVPPANMGNEWLEAFLHVTMSRINETPVFGVMSLIFDRYAPPLLSRVKKVVSDDASECFTVDEVKYRCRKKIGPGHKESALFLRSDKVESQVCILGTIESKGKSHIVALSNRTDFLVSAELNDILKAKSGPPPVLTLQMFVEPKEPQSGYRRTTIFQKVCKEVDHEVLIATLEKRNNPYVLFAYALSLCCEKLLPRNPKIRHFVDWALDSPCHPFVSNYDSEQASALLLALELFFLASGEETWGTPWGRIAEDASDEEIFLLGRSWCRLCQSAQGMRTFGPRSRSYFDFITKAIMKKTQSEAPVQLPNFKTKTKRKRSQKTTTDKHKKRRGKGGRDKK